MSVRLYTIAAGAVAAISCSSMMASKEGAESAKTSPSTQGRQVNVTQLYNDTCAKCHGIKGEGNGSSTKTLLTWEKFDQKMDKPFFDAIKNGVPQMGMDPYGQTNSDKEVWALVVHIRELQAKSLREQYGDPKSVDGVYSSKYAKYKIETVLDRNQGLKTPWAIDWLPDGRALVTNKPGSIFILKDGQVVSKVDGLPRTVEIGQGGLMDVAVHPNYAKNGWIYLSITDAKKDNDREGMTKIVRGKLKFTGDKVEWTSQETIFEADQEFYTGAGIHFGSRITFDGKGHIFFNVGERGGNMLAQELTNPFGKIYRVNEDGTIPSDNPYVKQAGSKKYLGGIWSFGHRNPQGLVWTADGKLWDTEHGPRGGDEVNQIEKGANYGWPVVAFSINYNDSPFQTPWPEPGQNITMPVMRWLPSIAPSGLDYGRGSAFPQWKGDLLAGGLAGQNLDRIRVKDNKLVEREELIHGMGRIRDVMVGPDGFIYVVLNGPDMIVRVVPAK